MDRRHEPRFPARRSVRIQLLSGSEQAQPGLLCEVSGTGLRLLTERPLPAGATVEIEDGELTWLGEVCYCQPAEDSYAAGVKVEHRLTLTADLVRLARQLRLEQGVAAKTQTD